MDPVYTTEYRLGMDHGIGVNSVTGSVLGAAVDAGPIENIAMAGGQDVNTSLTIINSFEEFQQSLDIDVAVNAQYGLFSGNAKFSFASRVGYQSQSTFMVARVVVKNAFRQATRAKLRPEVAEHIRKGNMDRFREQAGDVYVRGFETGGEFYGVLEISSSMRSAQTKIAASLQAKFGMPLAGGGVDSSMELNTQEKSAETRLVVNVFQNGGKGDDSITDAESMLQRYKEFPRLVSADNARPIRALLANYRTLDLPQQPNFIDVQNRILVLKDRVADLNSVLELRNKVKYVLNNQEYYVSPDVDALNDASVKLATLANGITRGASECASDFGKCSFEAFALPKVAFPERKADAPPPAVPAAPQASGGGGGANLGFAKTLVFARQARAERFIVRGG